MARQSPVSQLPEELDDDSPRLARLAKARLAKASGPWRGRVTGALADRAVAWTVAPVIAALLVREAAKVHLDEVSVRHLAFSFCALYIGSAVLAVTPGVALLSVVVRYRALGPATALGLLLAGSGGAAMAGFWAWYASPHFGRHCDVAIGLASVAVIAVFGRRGGLRAAGLSVPLLLALALGLAFTGLAFIQGDGTAQHAVSLISSRYWRTRDNTIPLLLAARVAAHARLSGHLVGDWLYSDRPPLQSGFALLQWPLWRGYDRQPAYQLLATGLSTSWLPALWVVLRVRGVGQWRTLVVVLATALTGFVFLNTVYVWPKMLAGALALAALAIVVSRDPADRRLASGIVAVALVTLGMLAHGGTAFAVLALIPFTWRLRRLVTVRGCAACAAVALAGYLPWALYQRFVDPPGNRLLKWMLAGVSSVGPPGFLSTVARQYHLLSLHELLVDKADNVAALVANPTAWQVQGAEPAWASGFLGYARIAQVDDLLPAAGLLLLGVLALLFPSARRGLAPVAPLAAFTAAAVAGWVLLLWGGDRMTTINHQGAYAVTVLFIALCALAVTYLPWPAATAILAGRAAWFAVSWIPGLGFTSAVAAKAPHGFKALHRAALAHHLDPATLLVCLAGVALAAAAIAWLRFAPADRRLLVPENAIPAQSPATL
jgi:hypothetical protein